MINSKNFEERLGKILKNRNKKEVVNGNINLENLKFSKRVEFIVKYISSLNAISKITYKISFWEENELMRKFLEINQSDKSYILDVLYKNGQKPGVVYIDNNKIDIKFIKALLINHFNHEMAISPSLSVGVCICINQEEFATVLDIYDDRGFHIYFL